ncbi:Phox homologous domain-containing protein [Irpex rosettiformis]|uniref:Phox homologous domain-containing protein n=1 Tax=Irpex rosettiformis TaxID=378272 RepID=A0ACB8TP51_9APHY|nr:Phox homologous domain-containing protein [Irpex rosettiformis]
MASASKLASSTSELQPLGQLAIPPAYALRKTTSMLEILPQEIDVAEEVRMYEDMCDTPIVESLSDEDTGETRRRVVRRSTLKRPDSIFSQDSRSIWLADNSGKGPSSTSTFAQDVQVIGWTSVGDKKGGAYIVYDCAIHTKEGAVMHVHKRYSAFEQLYMRLRSTLPTYQQHFIPQLPPKNPLSKFRATFLDKRRRALQHWLASVMLHPDIGGCEAIRQWVINS